MRAHHLISTIDRHPQAAEAEPANCGAVASRLFAPGGIEAWCRRLGRTFASPLAGLAQSQTVNLVGAAATAGAGLEELMKSEGFFKKFGVEPNIVSVADGSKLMGAVIGDSSDLVVISGFSQVPASIEKGAKLKVDRRDPFPGGRRDLQQAAGDTASRIWQGAPSAPDRRTRSFIT